jgi:hypothetical protein
MQPLSAPISDSQYLSNLIHLKFDHYSKRPSDNVILRREPKNLEILRAAQDDNSGELVGCRTASAFYFAENEMPNQRHEVCLKVIGSGAWIPSRWPSVLQSKWPETAHLEYWSVGDWRIQIADCGLGRHSA